MRGPFVCVLLTGGALLASSTWASLGQASSEAVNGTGSKASRSDAQPLHALAAEVLLPGPGRARPREDLRRLRSELASLALEIRAAEQDPSEANLEALGRRRRATEDAFLALRDRIRAAGGRDLVAHLEALFAPLWRDVDDALGSAGSRAERLASASARVEAALAQRSRPHGLSFTVHPFVLER
jgi:hypothetical protein